MSVQRELPYIILPYKYHEWEKDRMVLQLVHIRTIKTRYKAVIRDSEVKKIVKKLTGGFSFSAYRIADNAGISYEKSKVASNTTEECFEILNKFDTDAHIHAIFQVNFDYKDEDPLEFVNQYVEKKKMSSKSKKAIMRFMCYGITNNQYAGGTDYYTLMLRCSLEEIHKRFDSVCDFKYPSCHEGLLTYDLNILRCYESLMEAKVYLKLVELKYKYCKGCKHFPVTQDYYDLLIELDDNSEYEKRWCLLQNSAKCCLVRELKLDLYEEGTRAYI